MPLDFRIPTAVRVLPQRHDVLFRCGNAVGLQAVHGHLYLRAVREGYTWLVFDLRAIEPDIENDFMRHPPEDHSTIVKYTLRGLFPTALACRHAVARQAQHRVMAHEPAEAAA